MIRLIACFLATITTITLGAQTWPLPPPLETSHLLGKGRPSGQPPVPLTDSLFVAAVGENNALGYLVRRQIEPQRFEVTVRVVDLVDDHTLWEQSSPSSVGDDELTQWWHEHQNEVSSAFRRFGLVPLDDQLGEFPVILDEDYYAAYVRRSLAADTGLIHRLEVVVQSGRGVKTIFDAQGNWRWATLLGFIPSPFENRLAVVLLVQPEGWGGSQQPLRFIVTGASLKTGFVQP